MYITFRESVEHIPFEWVWSISLFGEGVLDVLGVYFLVALQDVLHGADYALEGLALDVEEPRVVLSKRECTRAMMEAARALLLSSESSPK